MRRKVICPQKVPPFETDTWVSFEHGVFGRAPSGLWYLDGGNEACLPRGLVSAYSSQLTSAQKRVILEPLALLPRTHRGHTFSFFAIERLDSRLWDARLVIIPSVGPGGAVGRGPTKTGAMNMAIHYARVIVDALRG